MNNHELNASDPSIKSTSRRTHHRTRALFAGVAVLTLAACASDAKTAPTTTATTATTEVTVRTSAPATTEAPTTVVTEQRTLTAAEKMTQHVDGAAILIAQALIDDVRREKLAAPLMGSPLSSTPNKEGFMTVGRIFIAHDQIQDGGYTEYEFSADGKAIENGLSIDPLSVDRIVLRMGRGSQGSLDVDNSYSLAMTKVDGAWKVDLEEEYESGKSAAAFSFDTSKPEGDTTNRSLNYLFLDAFHTQAFGVLNAGLNRVPLLEPSHADLS